MMSALAPAPEASAALDVDHVSASYGPYRALFDVSFSVPAHGITALIGANGAGKSTVARVVTGLLATSAGSIVLNGVDVTGQPAFKIARHGCAHVPEERGIFASLTVEENLRLLFRQKLGRRGVGEAMARAFGAFPILESRRKQVAGTLSGGQQRILSLAKVLAAPPRVLVADEISIGLAPVVIETLYDGLRRINETGTALLIVEQHLDRVLGMANNAVVLEHGVIAYNGSASGALAVAERLLESRRDRRPEPGRAGGGRSEPGRTEPGRTERGRLDGEPS
jgi:branched-chain amino acid transport system ATP-binding protein